MLLLAVFLLAASAVLVVSQVLHLEGFNPGPPIVFALTNVRTYNHVTDPSTQWTVRALGTPSLTFTSVGNHGACLNQCRRSSACVGYNFHWDTTRCDLFYQVPTAFSYDNVCINYQVSLH